MGSGELVAECLEAMSAALEQVAAVEPIYLSRAEKAAGVLALTRLEARVAAARLRLLAVADDVAEQAGVRDAAAWWAHAARIDRQPAAAALRLAQSLTHRWLVLAAAHTAGEVTTAQAEVIATALEDLPGDVDDMVRGRAETAMVEHAATFPPRQLRLLGARILHVVAPEVDEDHQRRLLEAEERAAHLRTRLTTHPHGDGTTTLRLLLPDASADRLLTYLHAWTNPRHPHAPPRAGYPQRLGQAFCALLEHLDPARLPLHGGIATTVVITIPLDHLRDGLGVATTDTDTPLTAAQARRLACTAHLLPVVLGGRSEILDVGRTRRLFTTAQRRALALRDHHCRAQGCTIPAAWCEAHHLHPWATGGPTDLTNAALLCSHHHHRAHDHHYHHHRTPTGDITFHRRT